MLRILDSSAILAFLKNESGAGKVHSLLERHGRACFVHAINLCEVFYVSLVESKNNERFANLAVHGLEQFGLRVSSELGPGFWRDAGRIKARFPHLSLGDAFCVALARRMEAQVVTADSGFRVVATSGECRVAFIR